MHNFVRMHNFGIDSCRGTLPPQGERLLVALGHAGDDGPEQLAMRVLHAGATILTASSVRPEVDSNWRALWQRPDDRQVLNPRLDLCAQEAEQCMEAVSYFRCALYVHSDNEKAAQLLELALALMVDAKDAGATVQLHDFVSNTHFARTVDDGHSGDEAYVTSATDEQAKKNIQQSMLAKAGELRAMKLSVVKKYAVAAGVDTDKMEAADDAENIKDAVIDLILKCEQTAAAGLCDRGHGACADGDGTTTLAIIVPEGAEEGPLLVTSPDGRTLSIDVPEGVCAGQTLHVAIPAIPAEPEYLADESVKPVTVTEHGTDARMPCPNTRAHEEAVLAHGEEVVAAAMSEHNAALQAALHSLGAPQEVAKQRNLNVIGMFLCGMQVQLSLPSAATAADLLAHVSAEHGVPARLCCAVAGGHLLQPTQGLRTSGVEAGDRVMLVVWEDPAADASLAAQLRRVGAIVPERTEVDESLLGRFDALYGSQETQESPQSDPLYGRHRCVAARIVASDGARRRFTQESAALRFAQMARGTPFLLPVGGRRIFNARCALQLAPFVSET